MCLINNTFKFVFVHIPKCGGTSVCHALSPLTTLFDLEIGGTEFGEQYQKLCSERIRIWKHSNSRDIRGQLGVEKWMRYFTFAFVRNPYTRAYSTYKYLKRHKKEHPEMASYESFDDYVGSDLWLKNGPNNMLLPQTEWVTLAGPGRRLLVNHLARMENMRDELDLILRSIGMDSFIPKIVIERKNASTTLGEKIQVKISSIKSIKERYAHDFELIGYDPDQIPFEVID
ncbi:MAG: sulfotransferase family 2 domain-containing protein [Pseudomonadota bacterium]